MTTQLSEVANYPSMSMSEDELITVLCTSLYPGAQASSCKLVISYCKAAGLDPMQKPVHIVPMWDSKSKSMRDVVMPGIGLYRIQASRSGRFAGQSEPEFGPMITATIGGAQVTYPEWCKVTVSKLMDNGQIAEFTACEYWLENYAVKGGAEKSVAPNAMWLKRGRGQLAKCAAAQALRIAFPEIGAQPTAEEMEGKAYQEHDVTPGYSPLSEKWIVEAKAAKTRKELRATWQQGLMSLQAVKDMQGYHALKGVVEELLKSLPDDAPAEQPKQEPIEGEVTHEVD